MYRGISRRLADPSLHERLKPFFQRRQTLSELLQWVHAGIKFNKGDIIRHSDPFEIIEYGQGMCREFSVLFTAVCLTNGYRARMVLDMSDHAWTEVWNAREKRWIPDMYERDWRKNLAEVYAFENGVMEDVTKNYKIGVNSLPR